MSNVTIEPAPSPNGTNHERLYLVSASSIGKPMALDAALRRGRSGIAIDTPRRGRDSMLGEGRQGDALAELESLLAQHLDGEIFERCQRAIDRLASQRAEQEEDGEVVDEREEDEPDDDEQRRKRRRAMQAFATNARDNWNWDESQIREELENGFPKNGLTHLGGQLSEDVETVMQKHLEEMGSGPTNVYRDMPQSKDKRRRMAKDRALARRDFGLDRLTPKGNELVNYGDREPVLAYDEATESANADSFAEFFPDALRIRTNAL